ncbi:MAG: protein YgfX [Burkholderiales bacterium]
MRIPPILYVPLGPSRLAGACIGVATLATLAVVLTFPVSPWQHAGLCAAVLASAWVAFERIAARRTPDAVIEVRVAHDLLIVVMRRDGRLVAGRVRPSTCVSSALTSIVWRRNGAWLSRTILVLPDMLPPEDFRKLRVMLRYARSGLAQDAPASHA